MEFKIRLDEKTNTFEKMYSEWEKNRMIPGNETPVTKQEFDRITEMTKRIVRCYQEEFELEKYRRDLNEYNCVIDIDLFSGSDSFLRIIDEGMPSISKEDPAAQADFFRAFFNRQITSKEMKDKLFMKKISDETEETEDIRTYILLRLMNKAFQSRIEDERSEKASFKDYLADLEGRNKTMTQKICRKYGELEEWIDELEKEVLNDPDCFCKGYSKNGRVVISRPWMCLEAKIISKKFGISEEKAKWCVFEENLAHELFHFFHGCCFGRTIMQSEVDGFLREIHESLAEYFCISYIIDGRALSYDEKYAKYASERYDPKDFKPGYETSNGGYDGAAVLLKTIGHGRTADSRLYQEIFEKSLSKDTAAEACAIIMKHKN